MRILAGKWAGMDLTSPSGRVRPTAEGVRGGWMEALGPLLRGAKLLELYAGSGALGLEAISRGARSCDFVENNASAIHALKANVARVRARKQTRIFVRDALEFATRLPAGSYDLALADPPYGSKQLDRLLEAWHARPFAGTLAVEHATDHTLSASGRSHRFGETTVTIFEVAPAALSALPSRLPPGVSRHRD